MEINKVNVTVGFDGHNIQFKMDGMVRSLVEYLDEKICGSRRSVFRNRYTELTRSCSPSIATTTITRLSNLLKILGYETNFSYEGDVEKYFLDSVTYNSTYKEIGIDKLYLPPEQEEQICEVDVWYKKIKEAIGNTYTIKYELYRNRMQTNAERFGLFLNTQGFNVLNLLHLDSGGRSNDEGFLVLSISERDGKFYPVYGSSFDVFEYTNSYPNDNIYLGEFTTYDEAYTALETTLQTEVDRVKELVKKACINNGDDLEEIDDIEELDYYIDDNTDEKIVQDSLTFKTMMSVDNCRGLEELVESLPLLKDASYSVTFTNDIVELTPNLVKEVEDRFPMIKLVKVEDK